MEGWCALLELELCFFADIALVTQLNVLLLGDIFCNYCDPVEDEELFRFAFHTGFMSSNAGQVSKHWLLCNVTVHTQVTDGVYRLLKHDLDMEKRKINHVRIPSEFTIDLMYEDVTIDGPLPYAYSGKEVEDSIKTITSTLKKNFEKSVAVETSADAVVSTRGLPDCVAVTVHKKPSIARLIFEFQQQGKMARLRGWLVKRGGLLSGWRPRWVTIADGFLMYGASEKSSVSNLTIVPLGECSGFRECSLQEAQVQVYVMFLLALLSTRTVSMCSVFCINSGHITFRFVVACFVLQRVTKLAGKYF